MTLLCVLMIVCGIVWIIGGLLHIIRRRFFLSPNLRGHLFGAMVWTAITGFQTEHLLLNRNAPDITGHGVVFVAGWIMVYSWQEFAERRRGELYRQQKRSLPYRLLVQTLWGPLALWLALSGVRLGDSLMHSPCEYDTCVNGTVQ